MTFQPDASTALAIHAIAAASWPGGADREDAIALFDAYRKQP